MATVLTTSNNSIRDNEQIFVLTSTTAASLIALSVGYVPRKIKLIDTTTGNTAEWYLGMPVANSLTMAGATGNVTVATTGGFDLSVNGQVGIPAALQPAAGVTVVICSR